MRLQVEIPDSLARQVSELAARQSVTVDQIVAAALIAHIGLAPLRPGIAERAKRGKVEDLDKILDRVPNVPPVPGDEL